MNLRKVYVIKRLQKLYPNLNIAEITDEIADKAFYILNIIDKQTDLKILFQYCEHKQTKTGIIHNLSTPYNLNLITQIINNSVDEIIFMLRDYIYLQGSYQVNKNKHKLKLKFITLITPNRIWPYIKLNKTIITTNLQTIAKIIKQLIQTLLKHILQILITDEITETQEIEIQQLINKTLNKYNKGGE